MAAPSYAHFRYYRPGFAFAVYADRVVITRRTHFKPVTIIHPVARIARVEVKGAPARLHLVMDDGSTAAYELTGHVVAAHDAILGVQ